jgi:hypothetical protein
VCKLTDPLAPGDPVTFRVTGTSSGGPVDLTVNGVVGTNCSTQDQYAFIPADFEVGSVVSIVETAPPNSQVAACAASIGLFGDPAPGISLPRCQVTPAFEATFRFFTIGERTVFARLANQPAVPTPSPTPTRTATATPTSPPPIIRTPVTQTATPTAVATTPPTSCGGAAHAPLAPAGGSGVRGLVTTTPTGSALVVADLVGLPPGAVPVITLRTTQGSESVVGLTGTVDGNPFPGPVTVTVNGTVVATGTLVCTGVGVVVPPFPPPLLPPSPPLPPLPPIPFAPLVCPSCTLDAGLSPEVPVIPEADSLVQVLVGLAALGVLLKLRARRRRDE